MTPWMFEIVIRIPTDELNANQLRCNRGGGWTEWWLLSNKAGNYETLSFPCRPTSSGLCECTLAEWIKWDGGTNSGMRIIDLTLAITCFKALHNAVPKCCSHVVPKFCSHHLGKNIVHWPTRTVRTPLAQEEPCHCQGCPNKWSLAFRIRVMSDVDCIWREKRPAKGPRLFWNISQASITLTEYMTHSSLLKSVLQKKPDHPL